MTPLSTRCYLRAIRALGLGLGLLACASEHGEPSPARDAAVDESTVAPDAQVPPESPLDAGADGSVWAPGDAGDLDTQPDGCMAETFYADGDGDGFGDATRPVRACAWPVGTVRDDRDCDDDCPTCRPDGVVAEACDGRDQNCNGEVDEGLLTPQYVDADHDQHGKSGSVAELRCGSTIGYSELADDCDDSEPGVHPDSVEACEPEGRDDDCDGAIDDGCSCSADRACVFRDEAGYPSCGLQECAGTLGACVHDASHEERCDGSDNDCDGQADELWQCGVNEACIDTTCAPDPVAQLVAGGDVSCVRRASGRLQCWGSHANGTLGAGATPLPDCAGGCSTRPFPLLARWDDVALSSGHGCAVHREPSHGLSCWGEGEHGQLGRAALELDSACGDTATPCSRAPVVVPGLTDVQNVAVGPHNTCVILGSGQARCFGRGDFGQLGNGAFGDHAAPEAVRAVDGSVLDDVRAIAVGAMHACAALEAGGVVCWGQNRAGELGLGDDAISSCGPAASCETRARAVPGLNGVSVRTLVAGDDFTCAVRDADGALLCWGANANGQLGLGDTDARFEPTLVPDLEVVQIDAGAQHVCARVAPFDEVFCWGRNERDESGIGRPRVAPTPARVSGSGEATLVAAGALHTCSLVGNGVQCWGENARGQLGNGQRAATGDPSSVAW